MNENAYCWCHRVGPWRLKAPEMRRVLPAVGFKLRPLLSLLRNAPSYAFKPVQQGAFIGLVTDDDASGRPPEGSGLPRRRRVYWKRMMMRGVGVDVRGQLGLGRRVYWERMMMRDCGVIRWHGVGGHGDPHGANCC